ncbi:hypothetical protein BU25DRAFT_472773, partial [Macroventuria anomochaeta]
SCFRVFEESHGVRQGIRRATASHIRAVYATQPRRLSNVGTQLAATYLNPGLVNHLSYPVEREDIYSGLLANVQKLNTQQCCKTLDSQFQLLPFNQHSTNMALRTSGPGSDQRSMLLQLLSVSYMPMRVETSTGNSALSGSVMNVQSNVALERVLSGPLAILMGNLTTTKSHM